MKNSFLLVMFALMVTTAFSQPVSPGSCDIFIKFDGTAAGKITLPDLSNTLGTNVTEFTVEFWCKRYAISAIDLWGHYLKNGYNEGKDIVIQVPDGEGFTCIFGNGTGKQKFSCSNYIKKILL